MARIRRLAESAKAFALPRLRAVVPPSLRAARQRRRVARVPMPKCVVPVEELGPFPEKGGWNQDWFDRFYSFAPDPWALESNRYEQAKYEHLLCTLPDERVGRVLEIGCSIGILTERLARRSAHLLAVDISELAVARAREKLADLPHVHVERMDMPRQFPTGSYDVIIASDVLYYWTHEELSGALRLLTDSLAAGGSLIALHWRLGNECDLTGDEVHDLLLAELSLTHAIDARTEQYRLDRWVRRA